MTFKTKSEFARMLGVSPQAINKACNTGKLDLVAEGKKSKIYLEGELTGEYIRSGTDQRNRADDQKTTKRKKKKKSADIKEPLTRITVPKNHSSKHDAEIKRIEAQTANLQLKFAEQMKAVILLEKVDKKFGNLSSILLNHFHPLGDRLAPIIAGLCGVNDHEKILEIKKIIDKEIFRGLEETKRVSLEEIK